MWLCEMPCCCAAAAVVAPQGEGPPDATALACLMALQPRPYATEPQGMRLFPSSSAHLDKVLGRQRLGHRQREGDQVVVLSQRPLEQEVLVVQQVLWSRVGAGWVGVAGE